jgi:hypothetical protein
MTAARPSVPATSAGSKERGRGPQEGMGQNQQWVAENHFKF